MGVARWPPRQYQDGPGMGVAVVPRERSPKPPKQKASGRLDGGGGPKWPPDVALKPGSLSLGPWGGRRCGSCAVAGGWSSHLSILQRPGEMQEKKGYREKDGGGEGKMGKWDGEK